MSSFYVWCIIFFCIGYLIVSDVSVARFFILILNLVKVEYNKIKWWMWMNPRTPWARYIMWRRSWKLAKELQDEIKMERESRSSDNSSKTSE